MCGGVQSSYDPCLRNSHVHSLTSANWSLHRLWTVTKLIYSLQVIDDNRLRSIMVLGAALFPPLPSCRPWKITTLMRKTWYFNFQCATFPCLICTEVWEAGKLLFMNCVWPETQNTWNEYVSDMMLKKLHLKHLVPFYCCFCPHLRLEVLLFREQL